MWCGERETGSSPVTTSNRKKAETTCKEFAGIDNRSIKTWFYTRHFGGDRRERPSTGGSMLLSKTVRVN